MGGEIAAVGPSDKENVEAGYDKEINAATGVKLAGIKTGEIDAAGARVAFDANPLNAWLDVSKRESKIKLGLHFIALSN